MAIPKSKRTTTPLSVLIEADTLACCTILICTDESRFPKRYRWCLTQQIIESAVRAKMHIANANSVYVNDHESANTLTAAPEEMPRETADTSLRCRAAHAVHGNNYNVIKKMHEYYRNIWRDEDV